MGLSNQLMNDELYETIEERLVIDTDNKLFRKYAVGLSVIFGIIYVEIIITKEHSKNKLLT